MMASGWDDVYAVLVVDMMGIAVRHNLMVLVCSMDKLRLVLHSTHN